MTTARQPTLTGRDHLDITEYDEPARLLAALKDASPAEGGLVWQFQLGPDDSAPTLAVGVRGATGALVWYEGDDQFVPVEGANTDWVDYWTWFGHESPMPPSSEVPVDRVYAAVEELIRTRRRPTCVTWR
jgi:hypothetical protein